MIAERQATQRALVDLPLQLSDHRMWIEHAFPFVDPRWGVAFYLLDPSQAWPVVLRGDLERRQGGLFSRSSSAALLPLGAVPLGELATLVHFDPWWVLLHAFPSLPRGTAELLGMQMPGPDPLWLEAYRATNIAVRFTLGGRRYGVTDLVFDQGMKRLVALEARTTLGRVQPFRYGEIDLTFLRRTAPAIRRP